MSHIDDDGLDEALRALGPPEGGRPIASAADILAQARPTPVAPRGLAGAKLAAVILAAVGAGFVGGAGVVGALWAGRGEGTGVATREEGEAPAAGDPRGPDDTPSRRSAPPSPAARERDGEASAARDPRGPDDTPSRRSAPPSPAARERDGEASAARERDGEASAPRESGGEASVALEASMPQPSPAPRGRVPEGREGVSDTPTITTREADAPAPAPPKPARPVEDDAVTTVRADDTTPFHIVAAAGLAFMANAPDDAPPVGAQLDVAATWTPAPSALSPEAALGISLAPHGAAMPSELRIGAAAGARYDFGVIAPALAWKFAVVPAGLGTQARDAAVDLDPPSPWQTGPALDVRFGPADGLALHTGATLDLGLPHPGKPLAVGGHVDVGVSIPLGGARKD